MSDEETREVKTEVKDVYIKDFGVIKNIAVTDLRKT